MTEIVNVRPFREGDIDILTRIDELAFGYTSGPGDNPMRTSACSIIGARSSRSWAVTRSASRRHTH